MRVQEVMTENVSVVDPDMRIPEIARRMRDEGIGALPVAEDQKLIGIVTDRDIRLNLPSPATSLSVWELNYLLARLTVRDVMSRSVITIGADRHAAEAARIMVDHKIGALPVLDGERLVGIVTETDFLRAFALSYAEAGPAR